MRQLAAIPIGFLVVIAAIACQRLELLDATGDNMRPVLERRGSYAKAGAENHVDFSRYLTGDAADGVSIATVNAGTVEVPTGLLVAADPFYLTADFTSPFRQEVPPGRYPVILAIANLGPWGERVAFATVKFSESPVVNWQLANTTDPSGLTEFFGVDAGLSCFVDAATAELFATVLRTFDEEHPDGNYYDDVLSHDLPPNSNWCDHRPDPDSALNAIIFSSGLGDGLYSSYWGIDEHGRIARLLSDFQLFDSVGPIVRK